MKKVSLEEIAGGALQEQFGKAFEKVIENLADPNTSYKEARKITVTLKFTQDEHRDDVACEISVSEKLAPQAQTKTTFAVGKDLKSGKVYAEEYVRNQMTIDSLMVNTESGEVLEKEEPPKAKIIDLRKAICN